MASEYSWPKPYLLGLYAKAVDEGCIRIVLRGATEEQRAAEWRSFKAAFLRLRRKADADFAIQMRPEYGLVQVRYEPELGKVLISFNSLPDNQSLPAIESVDGKRDIPQPAGVQPKPTPEEEAGDFDANALVSGMIDKLDIEEDEDGGRTEL